MILRAEFFMVVTLSSRVKGTENFEGLSRNKDEGGAFETSESITLILKVATQKNLVVVKVSLSV